MKEGGAEGGDAENGVVAIYRLKELRLKEGGEILNTIFVSNVESKYRIKLSDEC